MRSTYVYVKTRAQFGKQCIFNIQETNIDAEILPRPSLYNDYILQNPCHKSVQISEQFALHEAQTIGKSFKNDGMFHFEGGWPKEINPRDEETTARFRRRVEKEDDWAPSLRGLFSMAENCILQNSAINVYDHYFDDMIPTELVQPRYLRTLNVYADPDSIPRPVTNISWSPDSVAKIAVSYCYPEFGKTDDYSFVSYIWEIENSNEPWVALEPFCPAVVTEFNPRDPSVLASGLMSGQVCNWDMRTGNVPVQQSHLQFSHRNPANCLKWMMSKNNSEFFTGSPDGRIMWWDMRKLREPTEILIIDLDNTKETKVENATGVTSLNYEASMGTKFLFGTENGVIISGSRKSKTAADKLALRFQGHYGPVHSVDRNPFNPKYILSVGDWTSRIWAEDTKEGTLVATPFCKEFPTGGCWSKSRYSIFYVTNRRGELEAWDLLVGLNYPVVTMRLSEARLTTIAPHEEGTLVAVGDLSGNVYLVEASAGLTSFEKNDRVNLTSYLDRCSRYMKAIDTRLREIKLMKKDELSDKPDHEETENERNFDKPSRDEQPAKVKQSEKDPELEEAEDQYFKIIKAEKEKYESVEDFNDVEDMITKIPTKLDVNADNISVDSEDINGENGKNKLKEEEIVIVKRRKKIQESTDASQKITQDEEIIEVLEKEVKGRKMNERKVKGIAAKISSELLRGSKRPRAGMVKLAKPCDSICNIKVCCKDITSVKNQKQNQRKKIRGKITKTQNKKEESPNSEKSISSEEMVWKSIKKSPSTDIIMSKIELLEKQDIENELTTALNILSLSAKRTKEINVGDNVVLKQSSEKSLNSNTENEHSDGQTIQESLGEKEDEEGLDEILDEIPSALEATDRTSADFKSVELKKSITRKHKMIPTGDTCTPQRPLQTVRYVESFIKGPAPALPESTLQDSSIKRYKEEVEAARGRIYPRISAFPELLFRVSSPNASLPTDPDLMDHQPN